MGDIHPDGAWRACSGPWVHFSGAWALLASGGVESSLYRFPRGSRTRNPHADRVVRTVRIECLDHFVIFGERHLRHLLLSERFSSRRSAAPWVFALYASFTAARTAFYLEEVLQNVPTLVDAIPLDQGVLTENIGHRLAHPLPPSMTTRRLRCAGTPHATTSASRFKNAGPLLEVLDPARHLLVDRAGESEVRGLADRPWRCPRSSPPRLVRRSAPDRFPHYAFPQATHLFLGKRSGGSDGWCRRSSSRATCRSASVGSQKRAATEWCSRIPRFESSTATPRSRYRSRAAARSTA